MRTGMIGLGTMGTPVARNLLRAGFEVTVHDLRADAAKPLLAEGAHWADTPAQLLDAVDVALSMVFGPAEIEAVVRGEQGLLQADCRDRYWVDLTTSSPGLMRTLGAEFRERGGHPVDAPVTGSVDAAIRGDMILFVGGAETDIEAVRPVLEAIGTVRPVGAHGNGYVAKLVNNQLWKIHAAAVGEAMVAATKGGLDPKVWWEAMKGGAADSFVLHHDVPSIFAGHYDPSFPLSLVMKDLELIEDFLDDTGVDAEITRTMHRRFRLACERYGSDAGEMSVCRLLEDDSEVSLRVDGDWVPPWQVKHAAES